MSILTSEAETSTPSPHAGAVAQFRSLSDQIEHALTAQQELAQLLSACEIVPTSLAINRFAQGFGGRFGTEVILGRAAERLTLLQSIIGGHVHVEAETAQSGGTYLKHYLTGERAGVPFAIWATEYPAVSL